MKKEESAYEKKRKISFTDSATCSAFLCSAYVKAVEVQARKAQEPSSNVTRRLGLSPLPAVCHRMRLGCGIWLRVLFSTSTIGIQYTSSAEDMDGVSFSCEERSSRRHRVALKTYMEAGWNVVACPPNSVWFFYEPNYLWPFFFPNCPPTWPAETDAICPNRSSTAMLESVGLYS